MDSQRPTAQAIALAGDRIVAVGSDADVAGYAGPQTRVVELRGRTVLPGLTDAHAHLFSLGQSLGAVDLRGCASAHECAARVHSFSAGPAEWITGRGWDQTLFVDKQFPSHEVLDEAVPDRPVWLRRVDGHVGWANARALALAGVTPGTPEPAGGHILHEADGSLSGVLVDEAMALVERKIPSPTDEERKAAIVRAQDVALAHGLTEIHEMGIDPPTIAAYRDLLAEGRLSIRVYAFASAGGLRSAVDLPALDRILAQAPDPKESHALFKLRGIKMWSDGALGSRGAALLEPYTDDPGQKGTTITDEQVIESVARKALHRGWQLAVHAIGDRANRWVLDAYERAGCSPEKDHRFRIEHAQIIAPSDFARFASLGVIASMQPTHATSDMRWVEARLGPDRLQGAYAWRRLLDLHVHVLGGSDFPVEGVDPFAGLYAAVTRMDREGKPEGGWRPDQRMTEEEAVRAFTTDAAYGAFEDSWRGQVRAGFAADLTVLDRSLDGDTVRALHDAKATMTVVAGKIAFEGLPKVD
jgi:predicted amidohydrolase YtcJ